MSSKYSDLTSHEIGELITSLLEKIAQQQQGIEELEEENVRLNLIIKGHNPETIEDAINQMNAKYGVEEE